MLRAQHVPTLSASQLDLFTPNFPLDVLLFIPKSNSLRCHTRCKSQADFLIIEPSLIFWVTLDITWTTHLLIELELSHEAIVGFGDGSRFSYQLKCGLDCMVWIFAKEICYCNGDRAGFAHCAGEKG